MDTLIYIIVALLVIKEIADITKKANRKSKKSKGEIVEFNDYRRAKKTKKAKNKTDKITQIEETPKENEQRDYTNAYKPKKVMTANEKVAFMKIQEAASELGYTAVTKVRLFDLVEPKQFGDKGAQWKIQAKHVDFVILDKTLTARYIIELTDSSHDAEDRAERDQFVADILQNCGYKILFTRYVDKDRLIEWIRAQEGTVTNL